MKIIQGKYILRLVLRDVKSGFSLLIRLHVTQFGNKNIKYCVQFSLHITIREKYYYLKI